MGIEKNLWICFSLERIKNEGIFIIDFSLMSLTECKKLTGSSGTVYIFFLKSVNIQILWNVRPYRFVDRYKSTLMHSKNFRQYLKIL
jgi:hypothetical protein